MIGTDQDSRAAYLAWTEHRRFKYRGCAPDPDFPSRAAGDLSLSLDAWMGEDRDGAEPQRERTARQAAAVEVCLNCPVMVECDRYGLSVTSEGKLAEPEGIRGGRTALERHRLLIRERAQEVVVAPAPDRLLRTEQKLAVLRALAVCWEPVEVAVLAEMPDVRTANWQRSALVRLLGLPKDASRMRVLAVARERGLLDGVDVVADDGRVLAVPAESENLLMEWQGQKLLWPSRRAEVAAGEQQRRSAGRGVRSRSLRRRFARGVVGQEELGEVGGVESASVTTLFPLPTVLGVAA